MTVYYMHTIDDQPGTFDGDQICFLKGTGVAVMRRSLTEIKADRRRTKQFRTANGFNFDPTIYRHIRVRTP